MVLESERLIGDLGMVSISSSPAACREHPEAFLHRPLIAGERWQLGRQAGQRYFGHAELLAGGPGSPQQSIGCGEENSQSVEQNTPTSINASLSGASLSLRTGCIRVLVWR